MFCGLFCPFKMDESISNLKDICLISLLLLFLQKFRYLKQTV